MLEDWEFSKWNAKEHKKILTHYKDGIYKGQWHHSHVVMGLSWKRQCELIRVPCRHIKSTYKWKDIFQTQLTWQSLHLRNLQQKPQWAVYLSSNLSKASKQQEKEWVVPGNYTLQYEFLWASDLTDMKYICKLAWWSFKWRYNLNFSYTFAL